MKKQTDDSGRLYREDRFRDRRRHGLGRATAFAKAGASGAIASLPEACVISTEERTPLETKSCGIFSELRWR